MVNGELVDDPPDIAEMRAKGKIPPGVVPEITDTGEKVDIEAIKERDQERLAIQDDISDADWVANLPLASILTGKQKAAFDRDAIAYRKAEPLRREFGRGWSEIASRTPSAFAAPTLQRSTGCSGSTDQKTGLSARHLPKADAMARE